MILIYMVVLNCSVAIVAWCYIPEILPDVGVGLVFILFWIFNAISLFIFPIMVEYTGIRAAFGVFLASCVVAIIWVWVWFKESMGKTNEELLALYSTNPFSFARPDKSKKKEAEQIPDPNMLSSLGDDQSGESTGLV